MQLPIRSGLPHFGFKIRALVKRDHRIVSTDADQDAGLKGILLFALVPLAARPLSKPTRKSFCAFGSKIHRGVHVSSSVGTEGGAEDGTENRLRNDAALFEFTGYDNIHTNSASATALCVRQVAA